MSAHLTVLSHSPTAAITAARFAADEPLDARGTGWAKAARGILRRVDRVVCSPAPACQETAAALELTAVTDPLLRDWDMGRWRGQSLDDVATAEPAAMRTWLTDPDEAPHGGETLTDLLARAARWLRTVDGDGHTVAVTHASVVRAVVVTVLGGAPGGFWRIDTAPLTSTVLRGGPGAWRLRSTGNPLQKVR